LDALAGMSVSEDAEWERDRFQRLERLVGAAEDALMFPDDEPEPDPVPEWAQYEQESVQVELTPTAISEPVHLAAVPEPLCSHLP
jgi:hypothetical protein